MMIYVIVLGSIGVGLFMWLTGRLNVDNSGYLGAFIINLVGSGAIVVPVPGVAAVCAGAAPGLGLSPVALGFIGGAGATIGEVTGYLAGFGGQGLVSRFRFYGRVHGWVRRRGGVALFVFAVIPNPLFDIAGIAAGGLGYPLPKFLIYVGAGKVIRFVGVAFACRYGIEWIARVS